MAGETPPYPGSHTSTDPDSNSDNVRDGDLKLQNAVAAFRDRLRLGPETTARRTIAETTTTTQGELTPKTHATPQEAWNEFAKQVRDKQRTQIPPNGVLPRLQKNKKTLSEPHKGKTTTRNAWVTRQRDKPAPKQVMLDIDSSSTAGSEGSIVATPRAASVSSQASSSGLSKINGPKPGAKDPILADIQVYSADIPDHSEIVSTSQENLSGLGPPPAIDSKDRTRIFFQSSTSSATVLPTKMYMGYLRSESEYVKMLTAERSGHGRIPEICISGSRLVVKFRYKLACGTEKLFRISTPLDNISEITEIAHESSAVVMSLASPPEVFILGSDANPQKYRSSNVQFSEAHYGPIALHEDVRIDFGRWIVYCFELPAVAQPFWQNMKGAFLKNKTVMKSSPALELCPGVAPTLWQTLDSKTIDSLSLLEAQDDFYLPFEIRYLLEACLSLAVLHEDNIGQDFLRTLRSMEVSNAASMLAYIATKGQRRWNPHEIINNKDITRSSAFKIGRPPAHCCLVRKATVTPTTIYFSPPSVEMSHRLLRKYHHHQDRFLRVQFTDEKHKGSIRSQTWAGASQDEVWSRVSRALKQGIQIGGRHYNFLAYGNSQLRESAALFFCDDDDVTCASIRREMGNFDGIRNPARYAARMGQCLSTTRAVTPTYDYNKIDIPDIISYDKKWTFTDGVCKISRHLMEEVARSLKLSNSRTVLPSAVQFRRGGEKGLLVLWDDLGWRDIHIRPSQSKFPSNSRKLEIIKVSKTTSATLNRQTITILSCLGIPNRAFMDMLEQQVSDYDQLMVNSVAAQQVLRLQSDENGILPLLATMVADGFMDAQEPFVIASLDLWRSWCVKQLKDKGRLLVKDGAYVFGAVDETSKFKPRPHYICNTNKGSETLRGVDRRRNSPLPQIFLQVPKGGQYKVITGLCILGRNPSLHPGDIQLVEAVDVDALRHLHDVVVFPATGDQDIPSMCSGGDLDGDEFFVIWDPSLVQIRQYGSMHRSDTRSETDTDVTMDDITTFFVNYMKNNCLGLIAHAHLGMADRHGAAHPKCLKLANLHSQAVDFNKTGVPAVMSKDLDPALWPHFMEKNGKSYKSTSALGQMYDRVQKVDFQPNFKLPFDQRLLCAFNLLEEVCHSAEKLKAQYDHDLRNIMIQNSIATEFEVWTTFALSKPVVGSDYKMQETLGSLRSSLIDTIKAAAYAVIGSDKDKDVLPFAAACYKITNMQVLQKLADLKVNGEDPTTQNMPFISFPWLFARELGIIAAGSTSITDATCAVQSPAEDTPAASEATQASSTGNTRVDPGPNDTAVQEVIEADEIFEEREEDADDASPAWLAFGSA